MAYDTISSRIGTNTEILGGKPIIRGLRISVDQILQSLAGGLSVPELLHEYPELEEEDVRAVLLYAAELVKKEKIIHLEKA